MKNIVIGSRFFKREFHRSEKIIFNAGQENILPFKYEGLTDNPDGSCSLVFEGVRHCISGKKLFEGSHEVFSLKFSGRYRSLKVSWNFKFFKGVAGYESQIEFTSDTFPGGNWQKGDRQDRLDILPVAPDTEWFYLVELRASTDHHNSFADFSRHRLKPAARELHLDGNILITERRGGSGVIIMKMSPSHHDRREKIRSAFRINKSGIAVYGWGIEPHEIMLKKKMTTYPLAIIPYNGGHFGALEALRNFLRVRWERSFNRKPAVMVNPWGGGGIYLQKNMNERWLAEELRASSSLGAEVYQIDDGWESGSLAEICSGVPVSAKFWSVDKKKFPGGFSKLAREAGKNRMKLGIWFCPNFGRQYTNWQEESDFIADVFRRYGFEYFKIDGASHQSYAAEKNFDSLLKSAFIKSEKKITFNLDVTAGVRMGFLYSPEFGPLFPANRYPFARNGAANKYYPCNTLRNFWKLSHIIPPHLIQVEIPNIFFDPADFTLYGNNRYKDSDPGNPLYFGPLYCAMIGFFGSPLFWLQPSRTDGKLLKEYSKMTALFKRYRNSMHRGFVCPIGGQPSGSEFTGFMSMEGKSGLILVFRERTRQRQSSFFLPRVENAKVETVFSNTRVKASIDSHFLNVRLEDGPSFAFLHFSDAE